MVAQWAPWTLAAMWFDCLAAFLRLRDDGLSPGSLVGSARFAEASGRGGLDVTESIATEVVAPFYVRSAVPLNHLRGTSPIWKVNEGNTGWRSLAGVFVSFRCGVAHALSPDHVRTGCLESLTLCSG